MFSLDRPRDHDLHTIADFYEILCLISLDRVSSTDTLKDFIDDNRGQKSFELSDDTLEDVLGQVRWRIQAFGDWYPFSLIRDGRVLSAEENIADDHVWYVFLLLCGNLPLIADREKYKPLTDAFEEVSVRVLRMNWPSCGSVEPFGKNTTTFTGTKSERMNSLGVLMGGKPNLTADYFREGDAGDGGIDIAAWISLDSNEQRNVMSALAQCACSRSEWGRKQLEISGTRLGSLLLPTNPWSEMLFTPILFRDNQGSWAVDAEVARITLFDRLRIIHAIRASGGIEGFEIPVAIEEAYPPFPSH